MSPLQLAWRNLRGRRARTVLTTAGVTAGVPPVLEHRA